MLLVNGWTRVVPMPFRTVPAYSQTTHLALYLLSQESFSETAPGKPVGSGSSLVPTLVVFQAEECWLLSAFTKTAGYTRPNTRVL